MILAACSPSLQSMARSSRLLIYAPSQQTLSPQDRPGIETRQSAAFRFARRQPTPHFANACDVEWSRVRKPHSPISAPWVAQKIKRQHHRIDERLHGLGCAVVVVRSHTASLGASAVCTLAARGWADLCSEARSAPPKHQQMNPALWIPFNPGKPGYLRILLAADLNIAGFGVKACWVWRSRLRHYRRRRWCLVRLHRFRRWWRRHWGNAGNVASDGHSQLPAGGGDTVLKCTDVSVALVLAGNLANCPEPALRKLKERRPGAEAFGSYAKQATYRSLVLLHTLRRGGVAGAESEAWRPAGRRAHIGLLTFQGLLLGPPT